MKEHGDSFTRVSWQDYFSLHAAKYVWMHHEFCDFAISVVDRYCPDIAILAPAGVRCSVSESEPQAIQWFGWNRLYH